jgi:ribose transport system substrate-binding protein
MYNVNATWFQRMAGGLSAWAMLIVSGCGGSVDQSSPPPSVSQAGSKGSAAGPKLLFITNGSADWWNAVEKGMHDGAKAFGAQVEMRRTEGQSENQLRLIEDALILSDVQGVAISVLDANVPGIADKMRELRQSGKVVITIDSDGQPDTRRAYVGTDNRSAGIIAGKAAATLRPQGGETAVFVGVPSAANAIERREGFFEGAGKKFRQVELFKDEKDPNKAQANVVTAITKYPDIGVLLGLWSYNGPRIAEEANRSPEVRKKVTVVSFDLDELAIEQLEKGHIDVTVCQNPYEMGYRGVKLLKALIEDDKKTIEEILPDGATTNDTGARVIVPSKDSPIKGENVIDIKEMKEWLASKGLKSS